MITLFGASVFLQDNAYPKFKLVTSIFIILVNLNFFAFWGYVLLKGLKARLKGKEWLIKVMENVF